MFGNRKWEVNQCSAEEFCRVSMGLFLADLTLNWDLHSQSSDAKSVQYVADVVNAPPVLKPRSQYTMSEASLWAVKSW